MTIHKISRDEWSELTRMQGLVWKKVINKSEDEQSIYYVSDIKGVCNRRALDVVEDLGDYIRIVSTEPVKSEPYIRFNHTSSLGEKSTKSLHVERLKAHSPAPSSEKYLVRHLDGNKLNNDITNLERGTHKENGADYASSGKGKGHNCPNAAFSELEATLMYVMADLYGATNDTAKILGVNRNVLQNIYNGTSYQNVITDEVRIASKNFKRLFFLKILNQYKIAVEDICPCLETSNK